MDLIGRVLEILLYSVVLFLPWLVVTYYPFRGKLRLSANWIALFAAILAAGRIAFDITSNLSLLANPGLFLALLAVVYILCYALSVKDAPVVMAIHLAVVFVLAYGSTLAAKAVFNAVTSHLELWHCSWAYSLILLAFEVVFAGLYVLFRQPLITMVTNRKAEGAEKPFHLPKLTLPKKKAPAEEPAKEIPQAATPEPAVEPAAESVPAPAPVQEPQPEPNDPAPGFTPTAQQLLSSQFTSLNTRILESRHLRKDLRRQIDTMLECLNAKNYERLQAILLAMRQQFSTTSYGANAALSAPLDYYAHIAHSQGIPMEVEVKLTGDPTVDAADLIVVLGNLLDNALDACKAQKDGERRIQVAISQAEQGIGMVVKNTCSLPTRRDSSGAYLSNKYDGPGAGLQVVQTIAQRYNGSVVIDDTRSAFTVRVTLKG